MWTDCFHSWLCFIEHINSCETHCSGIGLVVVNAAWLEITLTSVLVLGLSCLLDKSVSNYLSHLNTVVWLVSVYFPLKNCFLRMELHTVEWILSCLPYTHKLLVVRWCCLTDHLPKTVQSRICVIGSSWNGPVVIEISNSLSCCQFCYQLIRHTSKESSPICGREFNCVQNRGLTTDCR